MGAAELLELQRLDDRLEGLRLDVSAVEARLRGSAELDGARSHCEAAQVSQRAAELAVRARELESATLRERARTLDRQLYSGSVRNPQELLALQRELDDVRGRLAAREESELEAMEAAEAGAAELAAATAAVAALEAARAEQAGPDADRLAALRAELSETVATRELAATRRTAAELELYRRVASHHRPAVVRISNDSCGGCRVPLGLVEVRAIRTRDRIVQCSNCDRILAP